MPRDRRIFIKIVLDFLILLTVGIPILIFHLVGQPKQRGFYCNDDSIRYPFQESTISSKVLYVVGVFLPTIIIVITEVVNESRQKLNSRGQVIVIYGRPIPRVIWRIYIQVGMFLFGACLSQLTTDIAKYSIGRLRPHFIDICRPSVDCTTVGNQHTYYANFTCTSGKDEKTLREARLSFPSGHSSFSAYTMIYAAIYLQAHMKCNTNKLLKPFIQFILVMMTWYTALSRVGDYKHHWSDVLFGFLQGAIVALIVGCFISDFFVKPTKKDDEMTLTDISNAPAANYNTIAAKIDIENQ